MEPEKAAAPKRTLTFTSKRAGYRRAGIAFSDRGTEIDPTALTLDQMRAIRDDESIAVERQALNFLIAEAEQAQAEAEAKMDAEKAKKGAK